jgi:3' exoribonuclease, RNase T-like
VTRWFLDTEFHEDGRVIDLISIALVSDDREYYAVASDGWDPAKCNEWVQQNVLPKLPANGSIEWRTRAKIAADVIWLLSRDKPEVWGYFADYDWVVFCQLYGRMIDLPKGFPMYCLDLKQELRRLGLKKENLPASLQHQDDEHNALSDARWNRDLYRYLQTYKALC